MSPIQKVWENHWDKLKVKWRRVLLAETRRKEIRYGMVVLFDKNTPSDRAFHLSSPANNEKRTVRPSFSCARIAHIGSRFAGSGWNRGK